MPNFWDSAPVIQQDGGGAFWQSAPLVTQDVGTVIDRRTGAPANVRAAVGAAVTPDDRLATLRKFYPDARPEGDDNFVFNDPRHGGRPTLYNEENRHILGIPIPSMGDIVSVGPEAAEALGGAMGVAGATASAVPTGGTSLVTVPAAAGLGAAAGREAYGLLAQRALGTEDTRPLPQHLTDTAITAGVNAVGQRVGELAGKGIDALAGTVNRYVRSGAADTGAAALRDFANLGVQPPTAGTVTGNRTSQIIESALSNTPGGATIMQRAADQSLSDLRGAADDIAQRIATGDGANPSGAVRTPQGVGETLKSAAEGAGDRFNDRILSKLAPALDTAVGTDTRVAVNNAREMADGLKAAIAAAPETRQPQLQAALDELEGVISDATAKGRTVTVGPEPGLGGPAAGNPQPIQYTEITRNPGIPFRILREARTALGRALDAPDVSGYTPKAEAALRKVYGQLNDDIYSAAKAAGPDAEKALATHDRYIRLNRNINLPTIQKIVDQQTDEQAFKYAMGLAKDGGSRLFALRRNSRPEEWDVVSSSVFGRLGRANPGAQGASELGDEAGDFSINTFLTNWNKLAPEARKALFQGTRYSQIVPEMETLGRVAERMKDAQKMANPSGTARNMLAAAGIGAAANEAINGDPKNAALGLAAGVIAPRVAAKVMTNPQVIRWLAQGARIPMSDPNAVTAHLGRLAAIAEAEPEIRGWASQLAQSLMPATPASGQPTSATAAGR